MSFARHAALAASLTLALAGFAGVSLTMHAQDNSSRHSGKPDVDPAVQRNIDSWNAKYPGVPDDWTHHRVVYSNPGTEQDAIANGAYEHWHNIVNDPRFIISEIKRRRGARDDGEFERWLDQRKKTDQGPKRDWSMDLGPSAKVPAAIFPAKYNFSTTNAAKCANASPPDYVVYPTGVAGVSLSQANIVAYDNIYPGCTPGTVPTVYWSYFTGTGSVVTSPIISPDGTKVAFIETAAGGATLRILKFVGGQGSDYNHPVAPTNSYASGTAWSTCPSAQSCVIGVPFADGNPDTTSSPYYDYGSDSIYVGESPATNSYLHKFTGVFNGSPAEVTGGGLNSGWPQLISASNPLASPVYDANFKCAPANCSGGTVFIGPTGSGSGPNYHSIAGVGGSNNTTNYASISNASSTGSTDAPLLDPAAGKVYVFVNDDHNGTNEGVWQLPESLAAGQGVEKTVGTNEVSGSLYSGAFDNAYYTSASWASPNGTLWVCGNNGGAPALYAIPISSGAMGTVVTGPTVGASGASCGPVTEFCSNGGAACTSTLGTDYIFVSPTTVPASGQVSGCTASTGCVISYTVSGTTATLKGAGPAPGGASGIIVDTQVSGGPTVLNLYFGNLSSASCAGVTGPVGNGTGGCAIQALQSAP